MNQRILLEVQGKKRLYQLFDDRCIQCDMAVGKVHAQNWQF